MGYSSSQISLMLISNVTAPRHKHFTENYTLFQWASYSYEEKKKRKKKELYSVL